MQLSTFATVSNEDWTSSFDAEMSAFGPEADTSTTARRINMGSKRGT
jgi:hypothetical protein